MLWKRIVDFGFHLLYNHLAWSYDIVSWSVSLGEWRTWQLASLQFVNGPDVLEIAHGPGHMLPEMAQKGWRVSALDLSPAMSRLARARLRRHGCDGSVSLLRCQIPDMPFRAESFDSILSQFPTNFIFQPETLQALNQMLKEGGRLVILPEGHLTGSGPLRRFIHWLFYITGQTIGNEKANRPEKEIDAFWGDIKKLMNACGFEIEIHRVRNEKSEATILVASKAQHLTSNI